MTQKINLKLSDCIEVMKNLEEGSIGGILTDPPYGLNFMSKKWDSLDDFQPDEESSDEVDDTPLSLSVENIHSQQAWHLNWLKEAYRVLKPGGTIKAFGGSRTFHRLAAAMEQAGFVDIKLEAWVYGSGFPKSLNVCKALQKKFTADGRTPTPEEQSLIDKFQGYGTALKPAFEPFVVGKKPESLIK